jgi:type VI secretion system secreted protein VgrG
MELLRAVSINGRSDQENCLYLVRIVPHLWQLSLTRHSRIWTKKTIPEIIQEVLEEEGVHDVDLRLRGSYEAEEHVCQYKESSLNFIQRWMEREGIYYFFEQTDSGETLVLTDDKSTATTSLANAIPYHTGSASDATASSAHFDMFTWRNNATPASIRFTDYDYGKPALDVVGKASVSKLGVGEQVTYGNRFFTPKQGDSLASIRAEDLRAQAMTYHAGGAVVGISAGYLFTLESHPRAALNAEYLAVSVEHTGYANGAEIWGKAIPFEGSSMYRVDVSAISGKQQYRHPEIAVWPRLDGFENAMVDGPATSEYAQIDDQGRYNLKFKFDEGTLKEGKASTWVRKMQPHAGTVEGWHFPERAGTEVVCAFLGGDPDRPIIVGALPTAIHPSPVSSANHTKNVIQTGGKNRFEMEDLDGQQRVTISTPHQKTFLHLGSPLSGLSQVYSGEGDEPDIPDHHAAIVSEGNSLIMTCGNQDINSGGDWHVVIAKNHLEEIGGNRVDEVTGYMHQTITGTLDQDVHGAVSNEYHDTFEQDVQGNVTQNFKSNHTMNIKGNQEIEVTGNMGWKTDGFWNHKIEGPKAETVAGMVQNVFLGVKSEFIGGAEMTEIIGLNFEMTGGAKIEIIGGVELNIVAALHLEVAPEGLNCKMFEGHIHTERFIAAAEETKAAAMESRLAAMEENISGVEETTCGIGQVINGLSSEQAGLKNTVSTLISELGGLHTKM